MGKWICPQCGWESAKWHGRCPQCGNWKLEEGSDNVGVKRAAGAPKIFSAAAITSQEKPKFSTGFEELDRVMGGGIVQGSVTLLAGEPGIGKSTILLQASCNASKMGKKALYVSAEESCGQIARRVQRVGAQSPGLFVCSTRNLDEALAGALSVSPDLVVFDSIQALALGGSASQIREESSKIIEFSKEGGIASIIVGHVTKDGTVAGPKVMEHLVDAVCQFEGGGTSLRIVRSTKNRFGSTDEIGCFEMKPWGIEEVTDPYGLFMTKGGGGAAGKCVTLSMEGKRCIPLEIEALVAQHYKGEAGKRVVNGLDYNRAAAIAAALQQHCGIRLSDKDLYLSTIAGAKTKEPGADLAMAMAMASSFRRVALPGMAAIGEVSLTGQIRPVEKFEQRVEAAERMGFASAIVPAAQKEMKAERKFSLFRVNNLNEALRILDQAENGNTKFF